MHYLPGVSHMFQFFSQSCDVIELLIDWEHVARALPLYLTKERQLDAYWQILCQANAGRVLDCEKRFSL